MAEDKKDTNAADAASDPQKEPGIFNPAQAKGVDGAASPDDAELDARIIEETITVPAKKPIAPVPLGTGTRSNTPPPRPPAQPAPPPPAKKPVLQDAPPVPPLPAREPNLQKSLATPQDTLSHAKLLESLSPPATKPPASPSRAIPVIGAEGESASVEEFGTFVPKPLPPESPKSVEPAESVAPLPAPIPKETPLPRSELPSIPTKDEFQTKPLRTPEPTPASTPAPLAEKAPISPAPNIPVPPKPPAATVPDKASSPPAPSPSKEPVLEKASEKKGAEGMAEILKEVKLPEERTSVLSDKRQPEEKKRTYDTSLSGVFEKENRSPVAQPAPNAEPKTQVSESASKKGAIASIVTPLHTLKDDLQGIVREKKISLVKAAALEQDKVRVPERIQRGRSRERSRTFAVVFTIVLLAILGSAAFFGVALIMRERSGIAQQAAPSSLLFAESSLPLPLDNVSPFDLKSLLAQARTQGAAALGSIVSIVPTVSDPSLESETEITRKATLEEFFTALGTRASPDLLRAVEQEFFFGIHTVDENAPLFVIPVVSYERAFAGMLDWEETMNADLAPVFTPVPDTLIGSDGLLQKRQFEDVVMRNYDVRALRDDAGVIQLYYSFPTRGLLIIAESQYSFAEILTRLRAERKL